MRVLLVVLTIAIQLYGLIDCAQRDDSEVRSLPRWGWILIIILGPLAIGAIAYLVAGRGNQYSRLCLNLSTSYSSKAKSRAIGNQGLSKAGHNLCG